MNNKIIISIVVAVVILGGYLLFKDAYQKIRQTQTTPLVTQPSSEQTAPQPSVSEQPGSETSQPSAGQAPAAEEKAVTYTNSGYLPGTLTVKKGETVTFKNQSQKSMWTASAVHPAHRVYPTTGGCLGSTFDACSGIQPGASWSFKFDISGTWKYHNHLNPGDTGTVVVE